MISFTLLIQIRASDANLLTLFSNDDDMRMIEQPTSDDGFYAD